MIFLDMDGVCADFVGAACELHGKPVSDVDCWNFFEKWGITEDEFWAPINSAGRGFWFKLKPYPWFDDLVVAVKDADPNFYICTKPSMQPACAAGKVNWIQHHFGKNFRRYILTPHKHPLASPGRLLIDDSDENCDKFVAHGGSAMPFPQPWNRSAEAESPMEFIKAGLEIYKEEALCQ